MTEDNQILDRPNPWPLGDAELGVLHALALHELSAPEQLAQLLGVDRAVVTRSLAQADTRGEAAEVSGRYRTTPLGRHRLQQEYPEAFRQLRDDPQVHGAFARFEVLNERLLAALLDWQTVPAGKERASNDHSDPEHDARVLDRLHRIVEQTQGVLGPWAAHDPLPERFLVRCSEALDRADAGDLRWVSAIDRGSLHTLWFQLHEHLLRALGRERPSATGV